MRGVTDIFISKEKLAIFWFLVALGCIIGTAWHLYGVAIEGRSRMLYVPIRNADVYLDDMLSTDTLNDQVNFCTRLTLESFFNRGPNGPTTDRLSQLFDPVGRDQADVDLRDSSYDYKKRKIHQMIELGEVNVLQNPDDGSADSRATGQLIRYSTDPLTNQSIMQAFTVVANMHWVRNNNMRDNKRFLFVCRDLQYSLREIFNTEK